MMRWILPIKEVIIVGGEAFVAVASIILFHHDAMNRKEESALIGSDTVLAA